MGEQTGVARREEFDLEDLQPDAAEDADEHVRNRPDDDGPRRDRGERADGTG